MGLRLVFALIRQHSPQHIPHSQLDLTELRPGILPGLADTRLLAALGVGARLGRNLGQKDNRQAVAYK